MLQSLKRFIKSKMNVLGYKLIMKTSSDTEIHNLLENMKYIPLAGCEYARYTIPLDYPPSREFHPRWGSSTSKIEQLTDYFSKFSDSYIKFLGFMRSLDVSHIPLQLDYSNFSAAWSGGAISPFDAFALYAMCAKYQPKRYFEIGSGMTTFFAKQAITDKSLNTKIICIDPEPRADVSCICDKIYKDPLETIDVKYFDELEAGDILFLYGSHRSFMNSDVTIFFIDILPRIKPGVIVHLHDIVLPWDYDNMFLNWYWNEQYLLAVYLMQGADNVIPLLPTAFICRSPEFAEFFQQPFVDLGEELNAGWQGGGSMWFTKRK